MTIYTCTEGAVLLYHLPKKPPGKALPQPRSHLPSRSPARDPAVDGQPRWWAAPSSRRPNPPRFPRGETVLRRPAAPGARAPPARHPEGPAGQRDRYCTTILVLFTTAAVGAASSTSASYVPTTKPTKPKRLMAMSLAMTRGCMPSA